MGNRETYIYALESNDGDIRYIGKSNNPKRRLSTHIKESTKHTLTHKQAWINSLIKLGELPKLSILDTVNYEEWELWERYYISLYKSWGFNLTNSTQGGDGKCSDNHEVVKKMTATLKEGYRTKRIVVWNKGTKGGSKWNVGLTRSEETKRKISESKKLYFSENEVWNKGLKTGLTSWNSGKEFGEETKIKMRLGSKRYRENNPVWNKGVKMKESSRLKMIENIPNKKSVMQFDSNGNFIKKFESIALAYKEVNCFGIGIVCKGKGKSAGGYIWVYTDDFDSNPNIVKDKVFLFKNKRS